MRKFNPFRFIIILITFIITISVIRYIPFAPIILIIVVVSMVRKTIKEQRSADETRQEEEPVYEETVNKEEQNPESTFITCDYCGSRVDTSKYATCNHCGGPYWDDAEWKKIRNREAR